MTFLQNYFKSYTNYEMTVTIAKFQSMSYKSFTKIYPPTNIVLIDAVSLVVDT